jgi:hypothetical protein
LGVVLNERQARALGARVPFVKQRIGNGQAPGEAIQAELEQRHQGREQARQLHAGTHWGYPRQRVQERQALTLGSWKGRLNALLLDLEELPEEDRQAAVTELREEVAALD